MSYPFRSGITVNELLGILALKGVSLVQPPALVLVNKASGTQVPFRFLQSKKGGATLFFQHQKGSAVLTWQEVEMYAQAFAIPADDFGLTAGWPGHASE